MVNPLFLPELREMLATQNEVELKAFCETLHPARTADFMEGLSADEAWQVLQHGTDDERVEIFAYFPHEFQVEILETQPRDQIARLIAEISPDDRVDMLSGVEEEIVNELLVLLPAADRRDIMRLSSYPEGVAGAIMTTDLAKLGENLTVREAFEALSHSAGDLETIYYLYIVDDAGHLRGVVSTRQLVSSMRKQNTRLADIMDTEITTVHVLEDQEEVARQVARLDLLAIPVLDDERRIVGIITHDDVMDVVREEATEDAHRIAAVDPLERGYLQTNLWTMSWKRGIWLTILFVGALATASALQSYEGPLDRWTWLVLFLPLVISCGGNTGNQSATLIITALSTGDVKLRDWAQIMRRELAIGIVLGGFLSVIGYMVACTMAPSLMEAFVLPLTVLLVVISGAVLGSALPMVFHRIGWDPALMSNPFVAGLIDILGILIYMNVAMQLLPLVEKTLPIVEKAIP
ncbi:magnesium transporter [Lignipirellula cremea]|uniref:Magnesium transporter MgtE n=1 Tax=Lignipirellula cremea TaxID=2528010 RepID=A0A518DPX4_9BACT|nr:magnesium transporter [Lignipirellula cremea]QDU93896.1 Magnesium transporter MgtE [Lignipirellula cremea]